MALEGCGQSGRMCGYSKVGMCLFSVLGGIQEEILTLIVLGRSEVASRKL